jgi:hypothetical protein
MAEPFRFEEKSFVQNRLDTSRISPMCFRQNAGQIFWSVTNGRRPNAGRAVLIDSSGYEIMIDHPQELAEFLLEFQKECTR